MTTSLKKTERKRRESLTLFTLRKGKNGITVLKDIKSLKGIFFFISVVAMPLL